MSLPRMSLHIGDYKKDTGHLRAAGHGAYLMLIMHYWATGGLPDDDEQLASIACLSDKEWRKWKPVLQRFFQEGWRHKRIDQELAEATEKYERRVEAGRRGGQAKAQNNPSNARAEPKQPITLTLTKEEVGGGGDARAREPSDFERSNVKPLVTKEATALAEEIAVIAGVGDPVDWPPGWCGAPMRVQTMLANGWQREIMLAEASATMKKKRDGPPDTINFFEKSFARAHARHAVPLPVVNVSSEPEVINGTNRQNHAESYHRNSRRRGFSAYAAECATRASGNFGSGD